MRSILLSLALLAGCAMTYQPPTIKPVDVTVPASAQRVELMRAARQVLAAEGFQIASADDASGVLSTLPRPMRVGLDQAHCGSNAGFDNTYLRDVRTRSSVAVNVLAGDGKLTVRANVDAEFRPGSTMQDLTLTCVSRGVIERALAEEIITKARAE